jgi:putative ABC transport system permease protein
VFGLLAPGATQEQANAEIDALTKRTATEFPQTHTNLDPRIVAYGGRSTGGSTLESVVTHLPILLVLIIACLTVGILMYARTATRDAEIATRYALGANRTRILSQLFAEALVLSGTAALVGLTAAHWGLKWGKAAFYSGQTTAPFWFHSGLSFTTVLYAIALAIVSAAVLGVLPALKATSARVQSQLQNLGSGGSTLRFGRVWTTVMIAQVAMTVVVVPPAIGIAFEGMRDRVIRGGFALEEYLAVEITVDRESGGSEETDAAFAARRERTYAELAQRLTQEPGVAAVTFGDRLPGMEVAVRRVEVEVTPGAAPVSTDEMWTANVGPGYFEAFDRSMAAGRAFVASDRADVARTVIVNEAFARRRFMNGMNPIGHRVRYRPGLGRPGPWFEIVGIVRDVGLTPTDLGEAPYIYHPASAGTVAPLVMGVRVKGDRDAVVRRVRAAAAQVDSRIRIDDMQPLDALAWKADLDGTVAGGAVAGIVLLGLVLAAVGLYSLTSVSVSRRMREIGLRTALGATPTRMLAPIFSRAAWIVGSGIAAGNVLLLVFIVFAAGRIPVALILRGLGVTSGVMLAVALLACLSPARRALRIQPTEALRHL